MNISLSGNQKALQMTGATELPPVDGGEVRGNPRVETPNLTVTVAPPTSASAGVPPADLEKAMTRDDGLGKLVDKALTGVSTAAVDAFIARMV